MIFLPNWGLFLRLRGCSECKICTLEVIKFYFVVRSKSFKISTKKWKSMNKK